MSELLARYIAELEDLLARVKRAGLELELAAPPAELVPAAFRRAERKGEAPQPPLAWIARELDRTGRRFTLWHADADAVLEEVGGFLERSGVRGAVEAERLRAALPGPPNLHAAYAVAVASVNERLARNGDARRLVAFAPLPWEPEEPLWLLVSPAQAQGLAVLGVFAPAPAPA